MTQQATMGLRQLKRERTHAEIVAAAATLFQQHGSAEASIRDIAGLAQVSEATLYNYFETKQHLILAVIESHSSFDELLELVKSRPPEDDPLSAFVGALTHNGWPTTAEIMSRSSWHTTIVSDPTLHGAYLLRQREFSLRLSEILSERGHRYGLNEADVTALSRCLVAAIEAAVDGPGAATPLHSWASRLNRTFARLAAGWSLAPAELPQNGQTS